MVKNTKNLLTMKKMMVNIIKRDTRMKYRVSGCVYSPKERKLQIYSTWIYEIVDSKEEAKKLAKEWKQSGLYIKIEEVLE